MTGKKSQREGQGIWGTGGQGEILWVMARLERLARWESKPLLCVCVSAIVCVYRVCTCVGVCTMPVLRVCVGGCYACARVYISCRDGTWRPRIAVYAHQVCSVCGHGYVLYFLCISLHAALITGYPMFLSLCPLFLCVSAIFPLVAVSLCKHVCMASVYL